MNWSLSKGICLSGGVGRGKTFLLKLFSRNKRQCFDIISCRTVADMYAKDGDYAIGQFVHNKYEASNVQDVFYQKEIGRCFDDLGDESMKRNWGNEKNVMGEILLNRYDKKDAWHFTHITTNLSADEIEQCYGTRLRSRFREMFNLIELPGVDRRK